MLDGSLSTARQPPISQDNVRPEPVTGEDMTTADLRARQTLDWMLQSTDTVAQSLELSTAGVTLPKKT